MQFLMKHLEKKQDQLNEAFRQLFHATQLDIGDCDEVLTVINEYLPGRTSLIGHYLRQVLCLAIDVMKTEDVLVKIKEME